MRLLIALSFVGLVGFGTPVAAPSAAGASGGTTICTGVLSGGPGLLVIPGNLDVPAGATCTLILASVGGSVTVEGTLHIGNAEVSGNLSSTGTVLINDAEVSGNIISGGPGAEFLAGPPFLLGTAMVGVGKNAIFNGNDVLALDAVLVTGNLICHDNLTLYLTFVVAGRASGQCA
jgi:hypothetical protein